MGRKFNSAFFWGSFLIPGIANAFGLGDITLNSALNQPLNAKIVVSQVGELGPEEIKSQLASSDAFQKAGVERDAFLNDIRFRVEVGNNGNATIHLTTQKPVVEPFLNFIVEVQWPQGKLMREYTLLLDPPVFSNESYQPVKSVPVPVKKATSSRAEVPSNSYVAPVRVPSVTQTPSSGAQAANTYGPIARNESLWSIAEKVRPSNAVTIHQTMLTLQEMNPQAFAQNNINLLKQGAVLRLPNIEDIRQKDVRAAVESVNQQNQSWKKENAHSREKKEALESQLGERVEALPEKNVEDSAHLKLVTPLEETMSSNSVVGSAERKGSSTQNGPVVNALMNEKLDKISLENEELKSRLNDVTEQVKTSEEIVQLKDRQIAELEQKLKELESKQAAPVAPLAAPKTEDDKAQAWLNNPVLLAGVAAAVIAIVVGLMLLRRKNADDESEHELADSKLAQVMSETRYSSTASESHSADLAENTSGTDKADTQEELVKQELGDVIGESEIYMAYGRFNHAAELLKQGCAAEPGRKDIRLKYLTVLAELGDKDEFIKQERVLSSVADESERAELNTLHVKLFGHENNMDDRFSNEVSETLNVANNEYDEPRGLEVESNFDEKSPTNMQSEETFDSHSATSDDFQFNNSEHVTDSALAERNDESAELDSLEFESLESDFSHDLSEEGSGDTNTFYVSEENTSINGADFELEFNHDHESEPVLAETHDAEKEEAVSPAELATDTAEKIAPQDDELNFDFNLDDDSQMASESAKSSDISFDEGSTNSIKLDEDDLDLLADLDETATKLDLARAYLEMGDASGARDILNEVISEGNENQKQDAMALLGQIA